MAKRIYNVRELGVDAGVIAERLVNATSPSMAIKHVASKKFDAAAAKSADVARLMADGVKLEEASE